MIELLQQSPIATHTHTHNTCTSTNALSHSAGDKLKCVIYMMPCIVFDLLSSQHIGSELIDKVDSITFVTRAEFEDIAS